MLIACISFVEPILLALLSVVSWSLILDHFISGVPPYEGVVLRWRLVGTAQRDATWHFGAMLDA